MPALPYEGVSAGRRGPGAPERPEHKEKEVKSLIRTVGLCSVAAFLLALVACNTTKGFGEDLDSLGENISDSAEDHGAR